MKAGKKWQMPAEIKEKWIEALLSGKYRQAHGTLVDIQYDEDADIEVALAHNGYCCLGVLGRVCGVTDDAMSGHDLPSELDSKHKIEIPETFKTHYQGHLDNPVGVLVKLNDGITHKYLVELPTTIVLPVLPKKTGVLFYSFEQIAEVIQDNIEGV